MLFSTLLPDWWEGEGRGRIMAMLESSHWFKEKINVYMKCYPDQ